MDFIKANNITLTNTIISYSFNKSINVETLFSNIKNDNIKSSVFKYRILKLHILINNQKIYVKIGSNFMILSTLFTNINLYQQILNMINDALNDEIIIVSQKNIVINSYYQLDKTKLNIIKNLEGNYTSHRNYYNIKMEYGWITIFKQSLKIIIRVQELNDIEKAYLFIESLNN